MAVCWPSFTGPTWWYFSHSCWTFSSSNPRLRVRTFFTFSVIWSSFSSSFKFVPSTRMHVRPWYYSSYSIDNFVFNSLRSQVHSKVHRLFHSKLAIRKSSSVTLMSSSIFASSFEVFGLSGVFDGAFFWCSLIWHFLGFNFWMVFCWDL